MLPLEYGRTVMRDRHWGWPLKDGALAITIQPRFTVHDDTDGFLDASTHPSMKIFPSVRPSIRPFVINVKLMPCSDKRIVVGEQQGLDQNHKINQIGIVTICSISNVYFCRGTDLKQLVINVRLNSRIENVVLLLSVLSNLEYKEGFGPKFWRTLSS